jgi:glycosyltransferase involved in cell wall biosynthesis
LAILIAMRVPHVDIVVPVRNEERDLAPSVRRLVAYLRESFPFRAQVTIADNGSTDATWVIADRLARELPEVRAVHMELPGRGRALRAIWSQSEAEVLAYMDVDLSTDLNALLPLMAPLLSGHSDLAIGTRLARGSRVIRGPNRELISRGYNLLLRTLMGVRFSDAQCGFKAIRRDQARALLPLTRDTGWFFDTELLVLAERAGRSLPVARRASAGPPGPAPPARPGPARSPVPGRGPARRDPRPTQGPREPVPETYTTTRSGYQVI